jgi:hypothetical protein
MSNLKVWGDPLEATNKTYEGEEILVNITIRGGQKFEDREYVPRRVWHNTQNKPAFIIGNGRSREGFDLETLRGKGTTYGCNAVYRDFESDYIVSLDRLISEEIANNYPLKEKPAYSTKINIQRYSEDFILVPRNPGMNTGATATHIARFDGHKEIYLLGFDSYNTDPKKTNNLYVDTNAYAKENEVHDYNIWTVQMVTLFTKYKDVDFYRVGSKIIDAYKEIQNLRHITYEKFKTKINK